MPDPFPTPCPIPPLFPRVVVAVMRVAPARPPPAARPPRCAGWARNPKGPQVTPFRHQMGRRGTILDFKTGIRLRIPARISPWGSRGPNPNFFFAYFGAKNAQKSIFWESFEFSATHSNGFGAQGPKGPTGRPVGGCPRGPGPQGAPWGPQGAPWGPKGALGPPWAPYSESADLLG